MAVSTVVVHHYLHAQNQHVHLILNKLVSTKISFLEPSQAILMFNSTNTNTLNIQWGNDFASSFSQICPSVRMLEENPSLTELLSCGKQLKETF